MEEKDALTPEQQPEQVDQPIKEQEIQEQPVEPTEAQPAAEQPAAEQPAAEQPTEEQPTEEQPTEEQLIAAAQQAFVKEQSSAQEVQYRYRWSYEQQKAADLGKKKKKHSGHAGLWAYALIMTTVFALCFGILVGVLLLDLIMPSDPVIQGGLSGDVTVVGGGDEQTIEVGALESVRNYTVVITAKTAAGVSTGTGFVLTENGYIATNYHVVENAQTIKVKFYDGTAAVAEMVGYSEIDDLAVIKIEAEGLYTAKLGSSANVKDGQNVYAVGTPAGEEYAWSVTKGVVSYGQREVKIYDDEGILQKKMKLIQTDTPVNPGNSGGPLVNSNGEVLGIITLKLSGSYENMGFAIPIDGAMTILNSIIETGKPGDSPISTKRPLIGIVGVGVEAGKYYISLEDRIQEVDAEYARQNPDTVFYAAYTGIWVQSTTPGLDASNKLKKDDIIVLADGQELATIYDLMDVINQHNGGDTVELTYYRNGVANIVDVELGYAD